jgi:VWFA-related protein
MNRCLKCLFIIGLLWINTSAATQDEVPQTTKGEIATDKKFEVKTELMEVRTVVTDRENRIIENLQRDDFELLENEQPQKISFFSISQVGNKRNQSVPSKNPKEAKGPVAPRNLQERLSELPVRTTLLYVDNLHLSYESLNQVKEALRHFVNEQMTDQDIVALATSSGTLGIAQQFTRNRQILLYAIEQIRVGPQVHKSLFTSTLAARVLKEGVFPMANGPALEAAMKAAAAEAIAEAMNREGVNSMPPGPERDAKEKEITERVLKELRLMPQVGTTSNAMRLAVDIVRRETNVYCPCRMVRTQAINRASHILSEATYTRKSTLAVLGGFAEQMTNLPGKRMIAVFSDGFSQYDSSGDVSNVEVLSAINRAARSGIVIYSIEAKGLSSPTTFDAGSNQFATQYDCGEPIVDQGCFPPDPEALTSTVTESEREEMNGLHSIAQDTGGKLFNDTNNLGDALGRAFDANRYYYVLSYYLSSSGNANKFRNVKVRVRNHPEYTVRTARGFAPLENDSKLEDEAALTPQQRLLRSMNLPLPVTDIPVSAQADFVETQNDDKQATITVYLDGEKFQYHEQDQRSAVELEILYAIYDGSGKQVDAISTHVEGKLSSERLEQAKTSGYRFSRRVTLKPGVYQVRVGVREIATDHMGTASAWVEIPELTPAKLEMSSLMLRSSLDTNPEASEGINVSELEQIKMVQGIPLYDRSDFCDYAFRVYEGNLNPAGSELMLRKELLRDGEPVKQEPWRPISSEDRNKDTKGWFDLDGDVELSGFTPGVYELRISVKNAAANNVVQRSAVFGVE